MELLFHNQVRLLTSIHFTGIWLEVPLQAITPSRMHAWRERTQNSSTVQLWRRCWTRHRNPWVYGSCLMPVFPLQIIRSQLSGSQVQWWRRNLQFSEGLNSTELCLGDFILKANTLRNCYFWKFYVLGNPEICTYIYPYKVRLKIL